MGWLEPAMRFGRQGLPFKLVFRWDREAASPVDDGPRGWEELQRSPVCSLGAWSGWLLCLKTHKRKKRTKEGKAPLKGVCRAFVCMFGVSSVGSVGSLQLRFAATCTSLFVGSSPKTSRGITDGLENPYPSFWAVILS